MSSNITHTKEFYENKNAYISKPTKVCIKCGVEKEKSQYTTARQHRDGKYPICFECARHKQKELEVVWLCSPCHRKEDMVKCQHN